MKPVLTTVITASGIVNRTLRDLVEHTAGAVERIVVHNRPSGIGPTRVRVETVIFADGAAAQAWGMSEDLTTGKWIPEREIIDWGDSGLDLAGSIVTLTEAEEEEG